MCKPTETVSLYAMLWRSLHDRSPRPDITFTGHGALPSCFAVSDLAAASLGLVAGTLRSLIDSASLPVVDRRLASLWFAMSLRPLNRPAPALWDPFAGDYATQDGWIRLHTNAAHHRHAMESVLGKPLNREALSVTVKGWQSATLEDAVVEAGGCAAAMRSEDEWQAHPQGQAVAREPLFLQKTTGFAPAPAWSLPAARPLLGIRVLDLTRIIAGPVATRLLAGLGAQVLRIDPPGWAEPTLEEEITPGKRCARLNLKSEKGKAQLRDLLTNADVVVHGYRADALAALGFDEETRSALAPGLVDVSLNAWGWSGPWRNRRGFDSLVQMACGIAHAGMMWRAGDKPTPLPVQALDHATGYLMAAAVLKGLYHRLHYQQGYQARLSLARTAALLMAFPQPTQEELAPRTRHDEMPYYEWSSFGLGARLKPPLWFSGTPLAWARTPSPLGSDEAKWEETEARR